jgi:aspartate beta-hydroxylase
MNPAPPQLQPLLAQASAALQRGDARGALQLLDQARDAAPGNTDVAMARAVACRMAGDDAGAVDALDQVLSADPYNFFALLSKGAAIERLAGTKAAARIYRDVLKIAPPDDKLPPPLRAQLDHARSVIDRDRAAREDFVQQALSDARARHGKAPTRFDEAVDIWLGKKKPHVQAPLLLHYPQLPAIPYLPREHFPWLADLEAATGTITSELHALMQAQARDFKPYIQFPAGAPVNQWEELNHSAKWSTLHLWRDGKKQADLCALAPRTTALLESLPLARQDGFAPTAMFSRLDAKTHIPPHTGSSNVRLITHLPLILPGRAWFRVGNETRDWKLGEAWVFDDTIEHEAMNEADTFRVILIFDVWNPFLSEAERELVTALMIAGNAYYEA